MALRKLGRNCARTQLIGGSTAFHSIPQLTSTEDIQDSEPFSLEQLNQIANTVRMGVKPALQQAHARLDTLRHENLMLHQQINLRNPAVAKTEVNQSQGMCSIKLRSGFLSFRKWTSVRGA